LPRAQQVGNLLHERFDRPLVSNILVTVRSQLREYFIMTDAALKALRDAVRISPDNIPLRLHLADTLAGLARYADAEQEYRQALALAPDNLDLKLGLASVFLQQDKNSAAMVVVEDIVKQKDPPGRAHVLYAKLLLRAGDIERAVRQYREGVAADAEAADLELASQLGIRADRDDDDEFEVVDGRQRAAWEEPGGGEEVPVERPRIAFADVGGMDHLKDEIRMKIILPLTNPDLFKAYGKSAGGGILMYGPPGCGKTHLARATAGEVKAAFLAIGINDVLEMWIGQSERNLHALFERARDNRPCVLFFDEVDALGAARSDLRHSSGRQLINQFLAELDGVQSSNDGVLILAATNAPWHLDAAFRRPGRFDRILFVPPPDAPARASILRIQLKGKPVENIDFDYLAKKSDGFSGADLKGVVDVAIEKKLREAMETGVPKPIATRDLQSAISSVKPTAREWFATARNYALYSNQGGLYDDILKYLKM
jgi:transitional endoplasmic reticulum ATPase